MSIFTDIRDINTLVQELEQVSVQVPVHEQVAIPVSNRYTRTINVPSRSNQDRGTQLTISTEIGLITITVVADGHGIYGGQFADICIEIFKSIVPECDWNEDDLTNALNHIISNIEETAYSKLKSYNGGSTLSILVDRESRDIWVANLGDLILPMKHLKF